MAGSAGISVSTLLRLYHDILHTTPIQYVLKYRLEQIRRELRTNPGSSIADAAYSCGFNDKLFQPLLSEGLRQHAVCLQEGLA
ncbi:MAG TPA: hypothetical protein DDX59_00900 [Lachnospiraceae bacterium]|nr:hypothetical protein [Lachnospiraceae bacterium]HAP72378.1 hypothetical protein [Lachnospiraceae bacterium]HBH70031.1 hypothetical protein [Lachnospiraceae bacterium]